MKKFLVVVVENGGCGPEIEVSIVDAIDYDSAFKDALSDECDGDEEKNDVGGDRWVESVIEMDPASKFI